MNKYEKWYASIIENAKDRKLDCYKETHHIVPRSLGGTDDKSNLVDLTAREHFICHWLLVHIHKGPAQHKMVYALNGMKRNGKDNQRYETPITSRVYAKLKEQFSIVHSATMKDKTPWNKGLTLDDEKYKVAGRKNKGKKHSQESIDRRVAKQTGQKRSDKTKELMSLASLGKPKGPMKEEFKKKRSDSLIGRPKNPDSVAKRAETLKVLAANGQHHSKQKKTCPHCGTEMNYILYGRWHGDRCKQNPANKKD
jgi:hypothetical protein